MKTRPLGCGISLLCSLALVLAALGGVLFISFAMFAAPKFKNLVYAETGFHPTMEDVSVNVFTGDCVFYNLKLENPHGVYDFGNFLTSKEVRFRVSPLKLLMGDIEFTEIYLDIEDINCTRINNSTYNLAEFLEKFSKICKVKKSSNNPVFKHFTLKIKNAHYIDRSATDKMNWKVNVNMNFSASDIGDVDAFIKELMEKLSESNAQFLARGARVLIDKKTEK